MNVVVIIALAGWVLASVVWEHTQSRARDLDEREHHASLMREIRRRADEQ